MFVLELFLTVFVVLQSVEEVLADDVGVYVAPVLLRHNLGQFSFVPFILKYTAF